MWDSLRNGRGRVVEQVTDFEPGVTQLVRVEDPQLRGTQRVRFSAYDGGCEISLELDYELKQPGLGGRLTDVLFVRRAARRRAAPHAAALRGRARGRPRPAS